MSEKPVQGMLSLLYHVVYNVDGWQEQFASDAGDPYQVIKEFGLDDKEQKALEDVAFSQEPERTQKLEELLRQFVLPEVEAFYATLKPYQGGNNGTEISEKPIRKMLSFLYSICYVDAWREKFIANKDSADAVMAAFDLDPKTQEMIRDVRGSNTDRLDKIHTLGVVIIEEVEQELQQYDAGSW